MFEETTLAVYSIYADYEKYCRELKRNGQECPSFFQYAFGAF